MKLLTVCIPCYNSIMEMHKAINSCLLMKDEVEVLIVDRHSHDETLQVAREYEEAYPDTVKVITTKEDVPFLKIALEHSEGLYFKILQCFDYLDQPSLVSVIETIRDFIRIQANLDLLVTDYKYVIPQEKEKRVSYKNVFPMETIFEWHNIKAFHKHFQIDLGSVIIKTSTLKKINTDHFRIKQVIVNLIRNAVDALAGSGMIKGILAVVSMYYLNVPFHCYGTRRKIHISKSNSYVDLMKSLWDLYDVYSLKSRRQRSYVIEYLSKVYVITVYLLLKSNQKEQIELLNVHLGFNDPKLYKALTKRVYGFLISSSNEKLYGMLIKVFEKVYQLEIEE